MLLLSRVASIVIVISFHAAGLLIGAGSVALAQEHSTRPKEAVIFDTDCDTDDVMALAYILGSGDFEIEAITSVHGASRSVVGARNFARLLSHFDLKTIPVYIGEAQAVDPTVKNAYPESIRLEAEKLAGLPLPDDTTAIRTDKTAVEWMTERLLKAAQDGRPLRILTLGPLSNLAKVLRTDPNAAKGIKQVVVMGGAVTVAGNLFDLDDFKAPNKVAEWNIFIDPLAAKEVLESSFGIEFLIIGLDASNHIPITQSFIDDFAKLKHNAYGQVTNAILQGIRNNYSVTHGEYLAWDPLAALVLDHPEVITSHLEIPLTVIVKKSGGTTDQEGRTVKALHGDRRKIALIAHPGMYKNFFFLSLTENKAPGALPKEE